MFEFKRFLFQTFFYFDVVTVAQKGKLGKKIHIFFFDFFQKQLAAIKRWKNLVRLETSVNYHHSTTLGFNLASSNLQDLVKLSAQGSWAQDLTSTTPPIFEANNSDNYKNCPAFFAGGAPLGPEGPERVGATGVDMTVEKDVSWETHPLSYTCLS